MKVHLEVVWDNEQQMYRANPNKAIYVFVFASLARERARQNIPGFASKSTRQKETDGWNAYLSLWRAFRACLALPQTTWLLCEDGAARELNAVATLQFLDRAKNVLGWED